MKKHVNYESSLKKKLALYKLLEDEFSDIEIRSTLVDLLLGLYNEDEQKIIQLLNELKKIYQSVREEFIPSE